MHKNLKERIVGTAGSISGIAGILGSYQICHTVCLGIVALLGVLGVTIVGMPLAFLTNLAVPFWMLAVFLLSITVVLYFTKRCVSKRMIMLNTGIIIAGIPFRPVQPYAPVFWVIGGVIAGCAIILFILNNLKKK
ncbi:hypothetical protein HY490_01845 [Candidatus Woesearchaeota archaeon]|nr:hypothetical protein [Candidatus Woesearchaeota archaeon]